MRKRSSRRSLPISADGARFGAACTASSCTQREGKGWAPWGGGDGVGRGGVRWGVAWRGGGGMRRGDVWEAAGWEWQGERGRIGGSRAGEAG